MLIDLQRTNNFLFSRILLKKQKCECEGRLKVRICNLFCEETLHLRQLKLDTVQDHGQLYKFYLNNYFV
jgi:hypothetical protein